MASVVAPLPALRLGRPRLASIDLSIAGLPDDIVLPPTPPLDSDQQVEELLKHLTSPILPEEQPLVAVIGVGYVGTHLVSAFSKHYDVIGFDLSEKRCRDLVDEFAGNGRARFTTSTEDLADATHYLISVPTLLLADKSIDTSYIREALKTVALRARPGSTIVIESSVAVGMTRELLGPLAQERGYFAGMSPERVDPGRVEPAVDAIPKVISGLDDIVPGSLNAITRLYGPVFDRVVPVSKPEVAEMTKLYENCQRMMCIAYVNEMADACIPFGVDPYEVCSAAASKPFGYMPYTPGVGVGGHCIPVNPFYLLSSSSFPLLQAATETMWRRPAEIARRAVEKALAHKRQKSACEKARVLVVGVGFKAGQSVLSNSPGLDLVRHLAGEQELDVHFADPLVGQEALPHVYRMDDADWTTEKLEAYDMVIVTMRQTGLDFDILDRTFGVDVEYWCH